MVGPNLATLTVASSAVTLDVNVRQNFSHAIDQQSQHVSVPHSLVSVH